jgi:hypothetical protein
MVRRSYCFFALIFLLVAAGGSHADQLPQLPAIPDVLDLKTYVLISIQN